MTDRFKLELYPEQLDIILVALDFAAREHPSVMTAISFRTVELFLKPIQKEQAEFKKIFQSKK